MAYTSLSFALFVIIAYVLYYIVPKRYQWTILLAGSCFFYVYATGFYSLFILFTIISIYIGSNAIQNNYANLKETVKANKETWSKEERKSFKAKAQKKSQLICAITLITNFAILAVLKYFGPAIGGLILPLGISFYTFQSTGYLIDVYRENADAEKNPFKLALFISFFPQIIQGPIGDFTQLHNQLTESHNLKWQDFKFGIQMILWGLFKKLVIADRAVSVINHFTANGGTSKFPHTGPYGGTAVLFVVLIYALQLYADFSGGIEISRGVSRLFGIDLGINFRQPYFATTLNDYWRRWHITLGAWMKKYVFYSLATSQTFLRLGRNISKGNGQKEVSQFRKHLGKVLPTSIATFIVFILVGIWHGSNLKYLAFGIWNGLVIMISLIFEPYFISLRNKLRIKETAFGHRVFQIIRTFILVLVGYVFDVAIDLQDSFSMIKRIFVDQSLSVFMSEWRSLGPRILDYLVIAFGLLVMFYIGIRLEKKKLNSPAELIENHHAVLQWLAILFGIIVILVFGKYGPKYNAADFVYMQF